MQRVAFGTWLHEHEASGVVRHDTKLVIASKTPAFLLFFRLDGDPWFGTRC